VKTDQLTVQFQAAAAAAAAAAAHTRHLQNDSAANPNFQQTEIDFPLFLYITVNTTII